MSSVKDYNLKFSKLITVTYPSNAPLLDNLGPGFFTVLLGV